MGLFKSEEEKQQIKDEKLNNIRTKYGLNEIGDKYKNAIDDINTELLNSGSLELSNMLSFDEKLATRMITHYLNILVQQNWIITRQLNDINNKLNK